MDVLARLTKEEQLIVRSIEAAELRAHNKMHQYRAEAEAQFNKLQAEAHAKSKVTLEHLTVLAKKYELTVEDAAFDFETLVFHARPEQ